MCLLKLLVVSLVGAVLFMNSFVLCIRHIHEMMYRSFDGAPACFRRLNGTHQFGCSSPRDGSYGVVHFIRNGTDLEDFVKNAVAGPYAVILSPLLFKKNVIDTLITSTKVSGIVLNTALMSEAEYEELLFSPDDECPNRYSGLENTCSVAWNPAANNFLLYDWPLPIFLINKLDHYNAIVECHDKFNPPLDESQLSRPLCSLHLNSHMFAAVDSETCLRRINYYGVNAAKYCDPLGNENVVLPSLPWRENDSRNLIIVGARMDAFSLFDGIAPGAMSAATGLVTFITTAHILHQMTSLNDNEQSNEVGVLFILFNGEAEDYIGSSRVVYDIQQGLFPSRNNKISMNNIRLFIEFSQLSSSKKVFLHQIPNKEVNEFVEYLNRSLSDIEFEISQVKELPPASFQSFYKMDKNLSGIILSNFDKSFVNKFYNSLFDTSKYLGYVYANGSVIDKSSIYNLQNRLANIANITAAYLYKTAFNKDPPPVDHQHSVSTVDELLHCYLETRKCRLMEEVGSVTSDKVPDLLPLYVGVKHPENYIATFTGYILAYLTSKKLPLTREKCINEETQKDHNYIWMNGESGKGECINSSVLLTPAESPAFIIPNYDWKSGLYSTWTESVWRDSSLGMYIKPYRLQEIMVLCTGLLVVIFSFTIVFLFNKKADFLFMSVSPTSC